MQSSQGLIWVTHNKPERVELGDHLTPGLVRCIRAENSSFKATIVALEGLEASNADKIVSVCSANEQNGGAEYVEDNGLISIDRVIEADDVQSFLKSLREKEKLSSQAFGLEPKMPLKLELSDSGRNYSLGLSLMLIARVL